MKKEIIPYEPDHAYTIIEEKLREHDMWLTNKAESEFWPVEWAKHPSATLMIGDRVILCGGVMILNRNCGEAWTLFADGFKKYPIACFKACKAVIDDAVREHNLVRVQAFISPGVNGGREFAERLGFEQEGLLRAVGPDNEDLYMYSKIIKER